MLSVGSNHRQQVLRIIAVLRQKQQQETDRATYCKSRQSSAVFCLDVVGYQLQEDFLFVMNSCEWRSLRGRIYL